MGGHSELQGKGAWIQTRDKSVAFLAICRTAISKPFKQNLVKLMTSLGDGRAGEPTLQAEETAKPRESKYRFICGEYVHCG